MTVHVNNIWDFIYDNQETQNPSMEQEVGYAKWLAMQPTNNAPQPTNMSFPVVNAQPFDNNQIVQDMPLAEIDNQNMSDLNSNQGPMDAMSMMGQFPQNMATTATDAAWNSQADQRTPPVEEPGFMDSIGSGIKDFWNDEEKMANLTIALNSMRLNPDANIAKSMENKLEHIRKRKGLTGSVKWLRAFAMKQTDPAKKQKFLDMAIMAEQNPSMAKGIIEKAMQAAHGIGAADNKAYEPRFDSKGKEYIPVYNPNTNTVEKVLTGTIGMSSRQKITFETEEKLRQTDVSRRDKKVAEFGASIENMGGQINKIDGIIQNLDEGAMSGFISDVFPTIRTATANLEQLKNYLGLDIIGSVTFGALSESEMKLAMSTAVPSGLGPKALKEWAISKVQAMRKFRTELYKKAEGMARADGYNSWLIAEAKMAEENAKLDFYNLNKAQQSQVSYEEWSNLNNDQRRTALKIMDGSK